MILVLFDVKVAPKITCFSAGDDVQVEEELYSKIYDVLDDIDSSELDVFLENNFNLNFFDKSTFKELVVQVLNGTYFEEYDSLLGGVVSLAKENLHIVFAFVFNIFAIVFLNEIFKTFCSEKYSDFKKVVNVIFSIILVLIVAWVMKDLAESVLSVCKKIFNFSTLLFPILLNLVLLSGASGTFSVYSGLSAFLLNTGANVFLFVLMPSAVSILILSLIGSIFSSKRFDKTIGIFKTIFKYVIGIMFGVFGLFSAVNLVSSGIKDGVGVKLTKYAIKNYVPVLGGYISEGFNFVQACSVLVKNAFGVCAILILFFIVLKPLVMYFVYHLTFKFLSLAVSYFGADMQSDLFENVSKCIGYFIAVLLGLFLIMFVFVYLIIISVAVV